MTTTNQPAETSVNSTVSEPKCNALSAGEIGDAVATVNQRVVHEQQNLVRTLLVAVISIGLLLTIIGFGVLFNLTKTLELETGLALAQHALNNAPKQMLESQQKINDVSRELVDLKRLLEKATESLTHDAQQYSSATTTTQKFDTRLHHIETDLVALTEQAERIQRDLSELKNHFKKSN